jgi:hypothetical protein
MSKDETKDQKQIIYGLTIVKSISEKKRETKSKTNGTQAKKK